MEANCSDGPDPSPTDGPVCIYASHFAFIVIFLIDSKLINDETYPYITYSLSPVPLGPFATDATFGRNRMASDTAVHVIVIMDHLMFTQKMEKLFVNADIKFFVPN